MTFTRTEEEFPGVDPETRRGRLSGGTHPVFLVKRDGLILVETDSLREAHTLSRNRGEGAVVTNARGVVIGRGG